MVQKHILTELVDLGFFCNIRWHKFPHALENIMIQIPEKPYWHITKLLWSIIFLELCFLNTLSEITGFWSRGRWNEKIAWRLKSGSRKGKADGGGASKGEQSRKTTGYGRFRRPRRLLVNGRRDFQCCCNSSKEEKVNFLQSFYFICVCATCVCATCVQPHGV